MRRDPRTWAFLVAATVVLGVQAGLAAAAPKRAVSKLPDRRTTPTGNFITLYAASAKGAFENVNVSVCTSAHTPKGTEAIPAFFTLRLSNGASVYLDPVAAKSPALKTTPLGPKQCVRGWISFDVPKGVHAKTLVYTYGKPITWAL